MKIIEAFSGIGSQAKALANIGVKYELFANIDWDINAIIAYDLIHKGIPDLKKYENYNKEELVKRLKNYQLSMDGKTPYIKIERLNIEILKRVLTAIERCNNLVSITDVKGKEIPEDIDLFTYSFPCQDLSIAGIWHGNQTGIDRNIKNRSGMLWEVERILKEMVALKKILPKFLLMENVSNIQSERHRNNFQEWKEYLRSIGYVNKVYNLNAKDFGIPQNRQRVYMISVFSGGNITTEGKIADYFKTHNLEDKEYLKEIVKKKVLIKDILKLDYSIEKYKKEADESQQNNTPSRIRIYNENDKIYDREGNFIDEIKTITTKQDRNPNSGVIEYDDKKGIKAPYRTLTPRECFLFMGFTENDFEKIIENNFNCGRNKKFFTNSKLFKMAGNSIVVNILEYIFTQIREIKENILEK